MVSGYRAIYAEEEINYSADSWTDGAYVLYCTDAYIYAMKYTSYKYVSLRLVT